MGTRLGSNRSRDRSAALLRSYRLRQLVGDPRGISREASAHGDELLRDLVGLRRLSGRPGGDADQRGVRSIRESLALHDGLVRCLAIAGRSLFHRVHPQSVRH